VLRWQGRPRKEEAQGSSQGQSSQKRNRASLSQDGDDEEDYNPSQAKSRKSGEFSAENEEQCVQAVVNLLLARDARKLPLKHDQLMVVFKERSNAKTKFVKDVLDSAGEKLKEVFGFELIKCEKSELQEEMSQSQCSQIAAGQKYYFLRNALPVPSGEAAAEENENAEEQENDAATEDKLCAARSDLLNVGKESAVPFGLIMIVCSQVMLSNAGIKEADLIERLNDINVEKGVHNSMFGGDAVHVLNTLCDQLYLEKGNGVDDGETVPHFFLGLRARKEITKERCVAFMEMCNGAPLNNSFKQELLRDAGEEEEEVA